MSRMPDGRGGPPSSGARTLAGLAAELSGVGSPPVPRKGTSVAVARMKPPTAYREALMKGDAGAPQWTSCCPQRAANPAYRQGGLFHDDTHSVRAGNHPRPIE